MSVSIKDENGNWRQAAGNSKAEYGASTVRSGIITTDEIGVGSLAVFTVTFDTPMPDSDYRITWDWNTAGGNITFAIVTITEKTANGFKLYVRNSDVTANPLTSHTLSWYAFKLYMDTEYNSLLIPTDYALSGVEDVTELHILSWYKKLGRMAMGEVCVYPQVDIAPSAILATGLPPAFCLENYGQHFISRAFVNGESAFIPVFVDYSGNLVTSGSAPTLHAGDYVTFNQTYLVAG